LSATLIDAAGISVPPVGVKEPAVVLEADADAAALVDVLVDDELEPQAATSAPSAVADAPNAAPWPKNVRREIWLSEEVEPLITNPFDA
jgi:hypothetical protein